MKTFDRVITFEWPMIVLVPMILAWLAASCVALATVTEKWYVVAATWNVIAGMRTLTRVLESYRARTFHCPICGAGPGREPLPGIAQCSACVALRRGRTPK